jgi:hypothetical protein
MLSTTTTGTTTWLRSATDGVRFDLTAASTPVWHRHGLDRSCDWHAALVRQFPVGDYWVRMSLAPMFNATGDPIWSVHWEPSVPQRMPAELCRAFDEGRRKAMREITEAAQVLRASPRPGTPPRPDLRPSRGTLATTGAST